MINNRTTHTTRYQRGMTMIELMVSVTISLIVLAGATVILVSANKSSNIQEDLVNMQVNSRFAMQQITDDLRSFWDSTYTVVRKELRRRYPRHAWPEDPWTAQAQKRPGRRRK